MIASAIEFSRCDMSRSGWERGQWPPLELFPLRSDIALRLTERPLRSYHSGGELCSTVFPCFLAGVNLWLNCQQVCCPGILVIHFFGCCFVNICGGCLDESFGTCDSSGKEHHAQLVQGLSNWQSEQQVTCNNLLHLQFRVHFWLAYFCVQFAVPADWEAPGWFLYSNR